MPKKLGLKLHEQHEAAGCGCRKLLGSANQEFWGSLNGILAKKVGNSHLGFRA